MAAVIATRATCQPSCDLTERESGMRTMRRCGANYLGVRRQVGAGAEPGYGDALQPELVAVNLVSPVDLLTHLTLSLEGDVGMERARQYKTGSFAAHDEIVSALDHASGMTVEQIRALMAAALAFAASFWQVSHPTPTLAALYEQVPRWGHVALDFAPRLRSLLEATAVGLAERGR